jgi:hypothetical protein
MIRLLISGQVFFECTCHVYNVHGHVVWMYSLISVGKDDLHCLSPADLDSGDKMSPY